ncbi:DNA-3-methyladenine glycosylase family protein [Microbacterium sp. GCS4]|uniref:DNA-3-methyladenine glycosylase family protein n=1 Tax=Microbacterium sp. GCS4 TaxID=1692239 RepID=UPI0006834D0D|nr:DNA-3-methyladenine glycosylase [Microbacterium sp. GCS4]KNY07831.1 3-methyladenine DNA glycosylase [Microbacterium sp. GCS4]
MTLAQDAAATRASAHARVESVYRPPHPLDLRRTVGMLRRGPGDPTMMFDGPVIWRTVRTGLGPATLALRSVGAEIRVSAWGDGAAEALDLVTALCGAEDDATGFDPSSHPLIAEVARRSPGLRLARTGEVFDALACAILEQKVTGLEAFRAWRLLVTKHGRRAPGPTPRPLYTAPTADEWRLIPSWDWHRAGVQPPQSKTIVRVAERGARVSRALLATTSGDDRDRVLTSLPGIGPWTSAETRIRALGDPDAVSVGDYHLAHEVGHALSGHRTDDAGMLQLLAPWAGHRQRVIRLIYASGVSEPRRGPRLTPADHRRH